MLSWNASETTSDKDLFIFEEKGNNRNINNNCIGSHCDCIENIKKCCCIENDEDRNSCSIELENEIHMKKKSDGSDEWKKEEKLKEEKLKDQKLIEENLKEEKIKEEKMKEEKMKKEMKDGPLSGNSSSVSYKKRKSLCNNRLFPLHPDCLSRCFSFLTFDDIMGVQIVCKYFKSVIQHALGTFNDCKSVVLNSKWAKLPAKEREFYMRQMRELRHLKVYAEAFMNNGMYIQEVASLVAQNVRTLRSLQLLSPESLLMDSTCKHDAFAFVPLKFARLVNLSMAGCQVLEWLHIFGNCDFSSLEKFEVCYYPLPHDHWSWNVSNDFTQQGVAGLHKILDTMCSLERLTVGFDLWFDSSSKTPPPEAFLSFNDDYNTLKDSQLQQQPQIIDVPPVGGYSQYRSYRGKLSEEDFGDIFTIALVRSETSRNLKRVIMKYRIDETNVPDSDQLNPVVDFFEATASFCGRYVSDVFAKITGSNDL